MDGQAIKGVSVLEARRECAILSFEFKADFPRPRMRGIKIGEGSLNWPAKRHLGI